MVANNMVQDKPDSIWCFTGVFYFSANYKRPIAKAKNKDGKGIGGTIRATANFI
jgi:hypothetical protein